MLRKKCKNCITEVCLKKKTVVHGLRRPSLLPSSCRHVTWTGALCPIRSVQETIPTRAQRPGGQGSAGKQAPERRTGSGTSVAFLQMSLQHPHPPDVSELMRVCTVDSCQSVYVNIQIFVLLTRLFVRLSSANAEGLA